MHPMPQIAPEEARQRAGRAARFLAADPRIKLIFLFGSAGGEIDLVSLNEAGVVLVHEVAETGICLHADPPERATEFVCRAIMRYLDFKPFLKEQWRLAGERLEERLRGFAS